MHWPNYTRETRLSSQGEEEVGCLLGSSIFSTWSLYWVSLCWMSRRPHSNFI